MGKQIISLPVKTVFKNLPFALKKSENVNCFAIYYSPKFSAAESLGYDRALSCRSVCPKTEISDQ